MSEDRRSEEIKKDINKDMRSEDDGTRNIGTEESGIRNAVPEEIGSDNIREKDILSEEMPDLDQTAYYVNEDGSRVRFEELLTDDELKNRIRERRKKAGRKNIRKKTRTVILLIIVFAMLLTMCGRDIVRLKAENIELKKQQAELKEERDRLEKELKNTKNKDYIQDQARKQLRLLNEGEILFLFGDDEYSSEKGKTENNEEKKTENKE